MKIIFHIEYRTAPGETLCVSGLIPASGVGDEVSTLELACTDGWHWQGSTELAVGSVAEYVYTLRAGGRELRREWGAPRRVTAEGAGTLCLYDVWHDMPEEAYLYTSPYRNAFAAPVDKAVPHLRAARQVELQVNCPYVMRGQTLVLPGESTELGGWDETRALRLRQVEHGRWSLVLPADALTRPVEYKPAIADRDTGHIVHWEEGGNRTLHPLPAGEEAACRIELVYRHGAMGRRAAGVAIPVFSLRTEASFGVGEFSDLRRLVDWAAATGMKMIQLLPVNDTTMTRSWADSYPYNAISIYALHPLYFGPADYPLNDAKRLHVFRRQAEALNALAEYDYEQALALKEAYLDSLYDERGEATLNDAPFRRFWDDNRHWLFPYACFCALRDRFHTAACRDWGAYSRYNRDALERMLAGDVTLRHAMRRVYFTQYLLHEQLSGVKDYAHRHGVVLKGDVPIGISRDSVEAWVEPELFHLDTQTGAPPDDFSATGQNWGFPTYNWERMAADGYRWWIRRFRKMADYFDAYRIDHILGFFRIWQIPAHSVQGLLGCFSPAQPLTREEIEAWGIPFDERRLLEPYIHERDLHELFGAYAGEVAEQFLNRLTWERYALKDFCNTQAKIRTLFDGHADERSRTLREGLYTLCNEVLFLRDRHAPDRYHPRIAASQTRSFRDLPQAEQEAFVRLHEHFFYQRHNDFWAEQAMHRLPALTAATGMLVCGEDLGMIPACVPAVMRDLQILSLEIERMPKQYGRCFADLAALPYRSVCTTSTHDMSPLRLWWTEDRILTQRYYNEVLQREGDAPADCPPDVCRQIVARHLHAPSMLAVLPLQDWLSLSADLRRPDPAGERINIPAIARHYWRYRMHLTIDDLLRADTLIAELRSLIAESGRG